MLFTGLVNNQYVGRNPVKITEDVMHTGQRRFNTYCSPCHDRTGQGRGVVAQRAIWIPTNLQEPRVKAFNDGEIFNVITQWAPLHAVVQVSNHGRGPLGDRGLRPSFAAHQFGTIEDVPADQRTSLK